MNVHDSEKVIGTLLQEGYRQVETVEEADLILYNTCSIRDKAEQKVFYRLADYKKLQAQGKTFGVLGCVAQQEGEKIFERAPHVSLVCGSASYRKLPEMLAQLEAGQLRKRKIEAARSETGERKPRSWCASPGLTIARQTNVSRRNSPRARILTADTSPSSKGATSSALIALSPTPVGKSAAGRRSRCWRKRGRWPTWATARFSCWGRT